MSDRIYGQGTDYDTTCRTVSEGSDNTCKLQKGSRWPTDEYNVTSLTRIWKCPRDLSVRLRPRYGDRDFLFRRLRIIDFDPMDDETHTTFYVRYNGFIDKPGKALVRERASTKTLEVTLYPGAGEEGAATFVYLAPTLVRAWASEKAPEFESPYDFRGFNAKPKVLFARDNRGVNIEGNIDELLQSFPHVVRSVRTQMDSPPDGHIYRNTEVIERQILQVVALG